MIYGHLVIAQNYSLCTAPFDVYNERRDIWMLFATSVALLLHKKSIKKIDSQTAKHAYFF